MSLAKMRPRLDRQGAVRAPACSSGLHPRYATVSAIECPEGRRPIPRVQLHFQATGLNGWIGHRQLARFLHRCNIEDVNAPRRPTIEERTCQHELPLIG